MARQWHGALHLGGLGDTIRLLLCNSRLVELNEETVQAAVNDLRDRTGKRVFTLIEIAEALSGGQRITPPGRRAPTDAEDNPLPELAPPVPAWVMTLNNILLWLGEEGKLPVERTAMVVFPPE
jgi:hypothetical protein